LKEKIVIEDTENKIEQVFMSFPATPVASPLKEELKLNMEITEEPRLTIITRFDN
jgi:hypothetical protein